MLSAAVRATPWLVPGTVAVLLLAAALARPVSRRLSSPWLLAAGLLATLGMVLVVTLTPSTDGGFWGRGRVASFAVSGEVFGQLTSVDHVSLNVLMLVPLALLVQLVPRPEMRRALVAAVVALPLAVELVQFALPVLGRSGFQMDDVVANTLGVLAGSVLGLLVRAALVRTGRARLLNRAGPAVPAAAAAVAPGRPGTGRRRRSRRSAV